MKGFLRVGAAIALMLLIAPVVVAASGNPALVTATWVIISYFVALRLLPAGRKAVAIPASIICGQLGWRFLQILVLGVPTWTLVSTAAVVGCLVWLLVSGSRWAAFATIAAEFAALGLVAPNVPAVFDQIAEQGLFRLLPAIVALYLCPAAAIGLLGPLTVQERRSDAKVARVFD